MYQTQLIKPELQKAEEFFREYWGEEFMYSGLAILPQVLLDNRVELNLSHAELYFIEKVFTLSFRGLVFIKDRDISNYNTSNINKVRKSLKEKGYLDFIVRDNEDRNRGVIYDFSGLRDAVRELVKKKKKMNSTIDYVDSDSEIKDLFALLYKDFQNNKDKYVIKNENTKSETKTKSVKKEVESKSENKNKEKEIVENIDFKTENKNETSEKNEDLFLEEYNKLHLKLLGFQVILNKNSKEKLKKYMLNEYRQRKRPLEIAFKIAEKKFLELEEKQRSSLKLQDLVRMALVGSLQYEKTMQVPSGLWTLNTLLKKVKEGKDFRSEYLKFENIANEEYDEEMQERYKENRLIEEKNKEKYIKKWGI